MGKKPRIINVEDKFEYWDYSCNGCQSTFILNYKEKKCPTCGEVKGFVNVAFEERLAPTLEIIALDVRYIERRLDVLEREIVAGQMKRAGQDYEL